MVGFDIDSKFPRSTAKLKKYFYEDLGLTPFKSGGKPTCNEKALIKLAAGSQSRKPQPAAKKILEIRRLQNTISKELAIEFVDGRFTTNYIPVSSMGRFKSTKDVFGKGQNAQNRRKFFNKYLMADPGYLIFTCDLSASDARYVAYMGQELSMMKAFNEGLDLHSHTADLMFQMDYDEVRRQEAEGIKAPLNEFSMTFRSWGKRCNHALNFGLGVNALAEQLEIPVHIARQLYKAYHTVYPRVKQGYQGDIINQIKTNRILTNCFGRRWFFQGNMRDMTKPFAVPAQSNTADIINRRGLIPMFYEERFSEAQLLRQVHDSLEFQIPIAIGVDRMFQMLKWLKESIEQPLHWKGQEFVIPLEIEAGLRLDPTREITIDRKGKETLASLIKEAETLQNEQR